jgi:hypothetical protein
LAWRSDYVLPAEVSLNPDRLRGQIDLHRLNADHMCIRTEIEDLGGECMRNRHNGDVGLFTQIEAQPQSAVRGEVAKTR